jgi:hypothetical protein
VEIALLITWVIKGNTEREKYISSQKAIFCQISMNTKYWRKNSGSYEKCMSEFAVDALEGGFF